MNSQLRVSAGVQARSASSRPSRTKASNKSRLLRDTIRRFHPLFAERLTELGQMVQHGLDLKTIKGLSTINARAETIATSRTWREPAKKRRCLIPVNAFYEWPKEAKPPKQLYAFELLSGNMFAFAGIWDAWKDGEGH